MTNRLLRFRRPASRASGYPFFGDQQEVKMTIPDQNTMHLCSQLGRLDFEVVSVPVAAILAQALARAYELAIVRSEEDDEEAVAPAAYEISPAGA